METFKKIELELLLAIRNHEELPTNDFEQQFESNWETYRIKFHELGKKELFFISAPVTGQGSYELTRKGKLRITELLSERCNEVETRLVQLRTKRNYSRFPVWNTMLQFIGRHTSGQLTRKSNQHHLVSNKAAIK
ncbi:MAG: hypothetical protein M3N30_01250 [Bacteroidota bacterium]|nr:hypothetical protein [Bacteroidota bacterium]